MSQLEIVNLDNLVCSNHPYRKFYMYLPMVEIGQELSPLTQHLGADGYGIDVLFRCLLLQFMEDLSDRELERFLQENTVAKWFCGFSLTQKTPDYSLFTRIRKRIGTNILSDLFALIRDKLKANGLISEVFTFVDASHLISKASLWEERDKAISDGYEKLNNEVLPKVARDKQARIGSKGKNKFWYGYKKHVSVDMQSGLINKVAVTPANVTDAKGFAHVCPQSGAAYMDKGYCVSPAPRIAQANHVHLAAVKKNNMKGKNKDLDRYYSQTRAPYEHVFSKQSHKARYMGIAKNQFSEFMKAMCFNLKRLLSLEKTYNICLTG